MRFTQKGSLTRHILRSCKNRFTQICILKTHNLIFKTLPEIHLQKREKIDNKKKFPVDNNLKDYK